jgi:hypothetical protein
MKKQIKRWGKSLIISFDEEEQEIYNLKEGTIIDLRDMVVVKNE